MNLINWVISHWVEIGAAVALTMASARSIVALTPTTKDDEILDKILKVVKVLGFKTK